MRQICLTCNKRRNIFKVLRLYLIYPFGQKPIKVLVKEWQKLEGQGFLLVRGAILATCQCRWRAVMCQMFNDSLAKTSGEQSENIFPLRKVFCSAFSVKKYHPVMITQQLLQHPC